jgi:hypothetical protein
MEEEEPSLVKKRSRVRLDSAPKCAMKRWSKGREQARFAGMVALIAAIEAHGPSPSKLRRLNLRGNNLGPASVEAFWAP